MIKLITQRYVIILLVVSAWVSTETHAHLLPAQRGTLNFADDGVYMVLSLPVSAFDDIDDNKNGLISMIEFNKHRADIVTRIKSGVVLSEKKDDKILQGLMLSPVPADEHTTSVDPEITRIYIMGKFVLSSSDSILHFRNDLYGKKSSERTFNISAIRKNEKHIFELTPKKSNMVLFGEAHKTK